MLRQAGIATPGALREAGAIGGYRRARAIWDGASLNLLRALAAGLRDRDWRGLTAVEKRALLDALGMFSPGAGSPRAP